MDWFAGFLEKYPELAVFLAIALGYLIGGVKFGEFSFGPVTGSLLAGLAIGQVAHVPVSPMAKAFLFLLFLFGIGYSVGPQFLQALRQSGVKPLLLALVCALTGPRDGRCRGADSRPRSRLFRRPPVRRPDPEPGDGHRHRGDRLPGPAGRRPRPADRPRRDRRRDLLRLRRHRHDLVLQRAGAPPARHRPQGRIPGAREEPRHEPHHPGGPVGLPPVRAARLRGARRRADRRPERGAGGEPAFPRRGCSSCACAATARSARSSPICASRPATSSPSAAAARPIIAILGPNAAEVEDRELLDSPFLTAEILVTERRDSSAQNLQSLADMPWARGIYLQSLRRGAQLLPLAADLVLERGDVLKLTGPQATVERGATQIGPQISPTTATDFIVLGFAIFLGGLAGALLRFNIAGIEVVLGTSVGALVAGLIVGHLRTRHPLFGRIPDGAVALMTSLGLAAFVAMTGLHAGPVFVPALKDAGLGLLARRPRRDDGAALRRPRLRPLGAADEPRAAPRRPRRRPHHDRRHGRGAGPRRQPRRGPRLHPGLPGRRRSC